MEDNKASDNDNSSASGGDSNSNAASKSNSTTSDPSSNGTANPRKRARLDLSGLASRQYLDQTVVPILLQGIAKVTKERPDDPVVYLANYLKEHKDTFNNGASGSSS